MGQLNQQSYSHHWGRNCLMAPIHQNFPGLQAELQFERAILHKRASIVGIRSTTRRILLSTPKSY